MSSMGAGDSGDAPTEQSPALPLDQLDKLLEHRVRLAICALLARSDKISFSRFKHVLEQTDGNLGAQLRKLEDADYIQVDKRFEGRKPVSWYALTASGRQALEAHLAAIHMLTQGALGSSGGSGGSP